MSVSKYEVFLKTVQCGSLTKAADALGYTQSGITYILNALESECGMVLLRRDRSGVTLTSDGQALLPYFQRLCESWRDVSEKIDDLKGLEAGHVRIGTFTSVSTHWLPGILHSFRQQFPGITFELVHGDYAEIVSGIEKGQLDCGFTQLPVTDALETMYLKKDPLMAVLPQQHPLAALPVVPLDKLLGEPFIMYAEDTAGGVRVFLNSQKQKPDTQFVVEDDHAIIAMVESGLGVSVLSELVLTRTNFRVAVRPLSPTHERELVLAYLPDNTYSAATAHFIAHVKAWAGQK